MIKTKEDLKFYLTEDRKQYNIPIPWRIGIFIGHEKSHAWRLVRALRLYEFARNNSQSYYGKIRLIFRKIRYSQLRIKTGIFIPPNTVGYGLKIPHFSGGVFVNAKAVGNYCTLNTGVVIGQKNTIENRPIIGNNVDLTIGCKIIGNVKIGDNAVVAPNSVVIKDVPDNALVSGVPAKIIKFKEPLNSMILES